jgi:hypothetical protein
VAADGDAGALTGAELAGALATGADDPAGGDPTGDSAGDATGDATGEDGGGGGGAVGRNVPTTAALCTGTRRPETEPLFANVKPITIVSPC